MRKILYILCFIGLCATANTQRKDIAQAKQWIKQGKNLEKAEQSMKRLLKDSANCKNKKIWLTWFEAVKAQYEQANDKLYLKQKYDTVGLFSLTKEMFDILQSFDSIDAAPNKKGKVKIKYRDEHAQFLNQFRPNLYNGGAFFLNKKRYDNAYSLYNAYISCAYQPLFSNYNYLDNDKRIPLASYWAFFCAYKQKKYNLALEHKNLALKDTIHHAYTLQYLSDIYQKTCDTGLYIKTLQEGFNLHPKFPYFFPRLVDFYVLHKQFDKAMNVIDKALQVDSANSMYRFAKSTVLLNTGKYKQCIDQCKELIAESDSMAEPYLNAGLAYFNQAVLLDKEPQPSKKVRKTILDYYRQALPYLEKYRQMAPEMKDKWCKPLYTIYLNLNMGKEFDEIDKLIKK